MGTTHIVIGRTGDRGAYVVVQHCDDDGARREHLHVAFDGEQVHQLIEKLLPLEKAEPTKSASGAYCTYDLSGMYCAKPAVSTTMPTRCAEHQGM